LLAATDCCQLVFCEFFSSHRTVIGMRRTGFGSATLSTFWRSTQTVACNILELFVSHAFQAFLISNVLKFLKIGPVSVLQKLAVSPPFSENRLQTRRSKSDHFKWLIVVLLVNKFLLIYGTLRRYCPEQSYKIFLMKYMLIFPSCLFLGFTKCFSLSVY